MTQAEQAVQRVLTTTVAYDGEYQISSQKVTDHHGVMARGHLPQREVVTLIVQRSKSIPASAVSLLRSTASGHGADLEYRAVLQ
jgi:hypothetical protein